MFYYESEQYEGDYWQGVLVVTDKTTGQCGNVSLVNDKGGNVTLSQLESSIRSHGVERALTTFAKLVTDWQG